MLAAEPEDARVLEEPADDRAHPDVLREARDLRAQATEATDHQVDRDVGGRGPVEGIDDLGIGQPVGLEHDTAEPAGGGLGLDRSQDLGAGRGRRDHEAPESGLDPRAGQQVEQLTHVRADVGVGGQEPNVLVRAGGERVVVAAPHVAVAPHLVAFAPHHEGGLRVGLEADQAVGDLHAGLLEGSGPGDVGLLVEPGLELHHRGHLLAGLGRPDQRGHDRAVVARPVEGLLDGHHVGVLGGPGHECLDRRGERLVGMVQQHVASASTAKRSAPGARCGEATGVQGSGARSGRSSAHSWRSPPRSTGTSKR